MMVWAPDKEWAEMVIRQVSTFPKGKHDDLVDSLSQSLRYLRDTGMLTRAVERMDQIEQDRIFKGRTPAPLYPG
jgi:phage terminase large subunit-like protein